DQFNLESKLCVAGGWVNDKLLRGECYDIDIASDNNMLGKELCEKVNEYMVSTGEEIQGIGVIQSNPDQCAEQDAYRRDLIVNSLFYNINTCLVEDLTGIGLDDLKSGRIVILARFEFEMVEELKAAVVVNDDVKYVIVDKSVENGLVMRLFLLMRSS
ncbi:putative CCA tRNA nucleotidyltransferase 2 isoform X1, partial [Tanacetum coccineum]